MEAKSEDVICSTFNTHQVGSPLSHTFISQHSGTLILNRLYNAQFKFNQSFNTSFEHQTKNLKENNKKEQR